jgi:anti-sigma B factor antagonist
MDIVTERRGIETIVSFRGSMDTETSTEAQQYLDGVLAAGGRRVLLDFGGLDLISSAGLRVLLATAKSLSAMGGDLRLCALSRSVHEVFRISGFDTLLSVYRDRVSAMEDWQ